VIKSMPACTRFKRKMVRSCCMIVDDLSKLPCRCHFQRTSCTTGRFQQRRFLCTVNRSVQVMRGRGGERKPNKRSFCIRSDTRE